MEKHKFHNKTQVPNPNNPKVVFRYAKYAFIGLQHSNECYEIENSFKTMKLPKNRKIDSTKTGPAQDITPVMTPIVRTRKKLFYKFSYF